MIKQEWKQSLGPQKILFLKVNQVHLLVPVNIKSTGLLRFILQQSYLHVIICQDVNVSQTNITHANFSLLVTDGV
jgi:hypothetical protein